MRWRTCIDQNDMIAVTKHLFGKFFWNITAHPIGLHDVHVDDILGQNFHLSQGLLHVIAFMYILPNAALHRLATQLFFGNRMQSCHYHNYYMNEINVVQFFSMDIIFMLTILPDIWWFQSSKRAFCCFLPSHDHCHFHGCAFHNQRQVIIVPLFVWMLRIDGSKKNGFSCIYILLEMENRKSPKMLFLKCS
jgi:hypothetical protein